MTDKTNLRVSHVLLSLVAAMLFASSVLAQGERDHGDDHRSNQCGDP